MLLKLQGISLPGLLSIVGKGKKANVGRPVVWQVQTIVWTRLVLTEMVTIDRVCVHSVFPKRLVQGVRQNDMRSMIIPRFGA